MAVDRKLFDFWFVLPPLWSISVSIGLLRRSSSVGRFDNVVPFVRTSFLTTQTRGNRTVE